MFYSLTDRILRSLYPTEKEAEHVFKVHRRRTGSIPQRPPVALVGLILQGDLLTEWRAVIGTRQTLVCRFQLPVCFTLYSAAPVWRKKEGSCR